MDENMKIVKVIGMVLSFGIAVYGIVIRPDLTWAFGICLFLTLVGLDYIK